IAARRRPRDCAADADRSDRNAQPAENHGTGLPAAAGKIAMDDRAVVARDEVAALAVSPSKRADAGADVRDDAVAVAERQEAEGRRQRDDPQLQVGNDRIPGPGKLVEAIHGLRRPLIEPDAEARIEVPAEPD